MITVTSLGGATIECSFDKTTTIVFADPKEKKKDGVLYVYGTPDPEPDEGTVSWPGEYDMEGIMMRGIGHDEGKHCSYVMEYDGYRLGFVHSPLHDWTDHNLELMGDIDVLFMPTDNPKLLQKIVDEIDPRVLIPLDTGGDEKHAESLKVCGALDKEPMKEYKIKGALPSEGRETVVLEA